MPSPSSYATVAARAGHRCEYCLAPEVLFNSPFEVEHATPRARGGTDSLDNLALACRWCNGHKADATTAIDLQTGHVVPLYHPRRDAWDTHFTLETGTGLIVGRTPVGRATAERLAMNASRAVRARLLWLALRLYP